MFNFPADSGDPSNPSMVFIGDEHENLAHVIQLTASIGDLVKGGTQVLFLEAFYSKDPVLAREDELAVYLPGRNFDHTTTPVGKRELPKVYAGLMERCAKAKLPVIGVDCPAPATTGPAYKVALTGLVPRNKHWATTIRKNCFGKKWTRIALFGGKRHTPGMRKEFKSISAVIWDRGSKSYIDLPS